MNQPRKVFNMTAKRTDLNNDEINKLYLEGMAINDLAKKFDCGYNTILRRISVVRAPKVRKDVYNWDQRVQMELKRLDQLSPEDKALILAFTEEGRSQRLSNARLIYYSHNLRLSKRWRTKNLIDMKKEDVMKTLNSIESSDMAQWTKQGYRISFKKFFQWLHNYLAEKNNQPLLGDKEYPATVSWIRTTIREQDRLLPEDVLNEDDVLKLINGAEGPRNKALIALLWDSGARIGEVLNIRLKHLQFDQHGGTVMLSGKTGSRKIRLVPAIPYLATLKENHPDKNNPDAFLFVGEGTVNHGQRISYACIESMLRNLREKTGIKKKISPHKFRHARASNLARKIKEPVLKELFGWTQKSQVVATYVHLSGRDIDNEKLRADGVDIPEDDYQDSKLKPHKCLRCGVQSAPTSQFCNKCGFVQTQEAAIELEQARETSARLIGQIYQEKGAISKDIIKDALKEMIRAGELKIS